MTSDKITFFAVGDISFGDFPFCMGYGVKSTIEKRSDTFSAEKIRHIFRKADFVFGNLETVLSTYGLDTGKIESIEMRGHPQSLEILKACNFNVLNLANNHAMQHGYKAFLETTALLEKNNIAQIGLAGSGEWGSKPIIIIKKDITFGFLGYGFETDKYVKGKLGYAFGFLDKIKHDIENLRGEVDYLIISYHFGLEFMDRPSVSNVRLARQTVDWGADVILGHHPHVIQGIERYKKGIIFYSLGNFIFDMSWNKSFQQSVIVKLVFDKINPIAFEVIPVLINQHYQPEPAEKKQRIEIIDKLKKLSCKVNEELVGDTEANSYKYYLEYERNRKRNRGESYLFFFKNIYRSDKSILFQIILRTVKRKIEDIGSLFS